MLSKQYLVDSIYDSTKKKKGVHIAGKVEELFGKARARSRSKNKQGPTTLPFAERAGRSIFIRDRALEEKYRELKPLKTQLMRHDNADLKVALGPNAAGRQGPPHDDERRPA